ncbi:MAG: hypothetical protein ACPGQL_09805 [Thermoplasmatota archaeon]
MNREPQTIRQATIITTLLALLLLAPTGVAEGPSAAELEAVKIDGLHGHGLDELCPKDPNKPNQSTLERCVYMAKEWAHEINKPCSRNLQLVKMWAESWLGPLPWFPTQCLQGRPLVELA